MRPLALPQVLCIVMYMDGPSGLCYWKHHTGTKHGGHCGCALRTQLMMDCVS